MARRLTLALQLMTYPRGINLGDYYVSGRPAGRPYTCGRLITNKELFLGISMGKLTLVLGGARSGKSSYAEQLVRESGGDQVLYVATARAGDDEMRERVRKHQQSRPAAWRTLEAPENIGSAVMASAGDAKAILIDCLTVLVANYLLAVAGPEDDPFGEPSADPFQVAIEERVKAEVESIAACARQLTADVVVVSNEVGMGVVPPYDLGRAYRDLLGRANQIMARHADEVYLLVAGIPMRIK